MATNAHLHLAPAPHVAERPVGEESPISVVLADDHALMRRSLRLVLDGDGIIEVVAEADDLAAVERHVDGHQPRVLVLDLGMPDGSGLPAIGNLRRSAPDTQIVVITMEDNPGFAQRALAAGASGFVLKDHAEEELAGAVRMAARGETYVTPKVATRLAALRGALTDEHLSPREAEVLQLIAFGHTSVEIARMLKLSPRTVETHRARIHQKLGLRTRAELVRYALARGLLSA
jgi:two-component system response regulator NreC